ncbi:tubulin epsilon chain-like [Centruroides sculpturatus]|uniref:tubulin epsilon chain-like n=1 Tax=Centruroides sculpturatus TaxID=218467 RepID=UPI000C6E8345|nr:tubulin epsilon chain-like [Centruroides sculpturatus]
MTQSIVVQVGQCGNQVGCRFWDLALREYAHVKANKVPFIENSVQSFFRLSDESSDAEENTLDSQQSLKARAVLIDMEEGVIKELLKSPLKHIFDNKQLITDVSGSGNNWAVGHKEYGSQYEEKISELIRREAEKCDCLQCFFLLHSMGGGTGSGLGTKILHILADDFPDVHRFVSTIFPSTDDDVITSPYNTLLAVHQLTEYADCVLPIENEALIDICNQVSKAIPQKKTRIEKSTGLSIQPESVITSSVGTTTRRNKQIFDHMNNIVANLLLNLTSSSRFSGSLNVDLQEIVMNLIPYPRMHYLVSSLTPLYALIDANIPSRRLDQMFTEAFSQHHHLLKTDPRSGVYLTCALLVRGQVQISDIRRNIDRLENGLVFVPWNNDRWKTGLCSVPPVGHPYSLLTLSNNTCINSSFINVKKRFMQMYRKKAHLHHFLQVDGMGVDDFQEAILSVTNLISEYKAVEDLVYENPPPPPRLKVLV